MQFQLRMRDSLCLLHTIDTISSFRNQLYASVHIHSDASGCAWILPRTKKHATGMFFTPPSVGPSSSNPESDAKK